MQLDPQSLKTRHRELRESLPDDVSLRIHRALSWLKAEEECAEPDEKFIFLWIAFNAAYAQEIDPDIALSDRGQFRDFLDRLVRLDRDDLIYEIVWKNYTAKFRVFIDNPYVSRPFWAFHNGRLSEAEWKRKFRHSCREVTRALANKDTVVFTGILFDRLYVLRNQLIHGGATWKSKVNRSQVSDGSRILKQIVPVIIRLLMEHPDEPWGRPCYPPVEH